MDPVAPWIERTLESVRSRFPQERFPHAILVDSRPGWGAEEFAAAWVQAQLQLESDPREVPHPDILWVQPDDSSLKIEQVRDLIEFVNHSVQFASRKVVVVNGIETASIGASNAMLKSLEEPPPRTHLILLTEAIDLLLPTIRSRCQTVSLDSAPNEEVQSWLSEQGVSEQAIEQFGTEYDHAPYLILDAVSHERLSLATKLRTVWRDPEQVLKIALELRNEDIDDLLIRWMRIARQVAVNGGWHRVYGFWDDLVASRRAFNNVSGLNRQLQIERLVIRWSQLNH